MTILQALMQLSPAELSFPPFVKPSDEARTLTTTLAADSDLQFNTEPNTKYYIRCAFVCSAAATPDFKWTVGHTGTTTAALFGARHGGNTSSPSALLSVGVRDYWMITADMMAAGSPVNVVNGNADGAFRGVGYFEGVLSVGASGGVFSLKWAQNTSDAAAATVHAGSWLHRSIITSGLTVKAADTSRTTDTTATVDPDLQAVLATGQDHVMHLLAFGSAGETPDFKIGIDDGGGTPTYFGGFVNISENAYTLANIATGNEQMVKPISALTGAITQPMTGSDTAGTGNFYDLVCAGRFSVAANPFGLIWAQNTSSATATKILKDSFLILRPIGPEDQFIWKTTDEARASTATLADDSQLLVTLQPNATYLINILALFESPATPDFKCDLEFTGTCLDFTGIVDSRAQAILTNSTNGITVSFGFTGTVGAFDTFTEDGDSSADTYGGVRYSGLIRTGAAGGVLSFRWAQALNTAVDTKVLAGSYLLAERKA
jgi:hypothetical protein